MSKRVIRSLLYTLCLSVCLAAALLAFQAGAGHAAPREQVVPASPQAKGSIAGKVRGPGGAPLGDIKVRLDRALFPSDWNQAGLVTTETDGSYKIDQLAPGTYRVFFYDDNQVYASQFYSQALTGDGGVQLAINGNELAAIDAQLAVGGSIAGNVDQTGDVFGGVGAYAEVGGQWQLVADARLDDAHHFELRPLAPAIYHVCVTDGNWFAGGPPCYDHIGGGVANATDVPLGAGDSITGIDIASHGFEDAAAINGSVTTRDGEALAGIRVNAVAGGMPDNYYSAPVAVAQTDTQGQYLLSDLPADDYILEFWDTHWNYLPQIYWNTDSSKGAEVITLQPYEQRSNVNARLALGGVISGTLLFGGGFPPPQATINAIVVNPAPYTSQLTFPGTYDPASGRYVIKLLPPGLYTVIASASDPANSSLNYQQVYSDGSNGGTPTYLTITYGSQLGGIDIGLATGAYEGTLTGTVTTGSGQPLSGIKVELLYWDAALAPPLVYALTDARGHFQFDGLADSSYYVRYVDPTGLYAPVYWNNQPNPRFAQSLYVSNGKPSTRGDEVMARSGQIRGEVHNVGGAAIKGAEVIIALDGEMLVRVSTDANGAYASGPLPAGSYQVCTYAYLAAKYTRACIGYEYGVDSPGLTIPLEEGGDKTVDFVLGYVAHMPYKQYLPAVADEALLP